MRQKEFDLKLAFNRRGKVKKNGKCDLDVYVTVPGEGRKIMLIGEFPPEHWDHAANWIAPTLPYFDLESQILKDKLDKLRREALVMRLHGREITSRDVDRLLGVEMTTFNDYFKKVISEDRGLSESSKQAYMQTYDILSVFDAKIPFRDINPSFIRSFDNYLRGREYSDNTVAKHHKGMIKVINAAMIDDLITKNPYLGFKHGFKTGEKEHLTDEELTNIENLKPEGRLLLARDIFLFACYTGLRFSDVMSLTERDIQKTKGATVLSKEMVKVRRKISLPIDKLYGGKALKLINKYKSEDRASIFPYISNPDINRLLKDIQAEAKITKKIMFKMSRDTMACKIARETGDPILIKSLLGHSKLETSMIYTRLTSDEVRNAAEKINW